MIERIKKIINMIGVDDYIIREERERSLELYFVRRELDTKRSVSRCDHTVTLFRDHTDGENEWRGMSRVIVFESMSDEEIRDKLRAGYDAALYIKAESYAMAEGVSDRRECPEVSPDDVAERYREAMYEPDVESDAFINSAEIFTTLKYVRIVSSRSTDVAYATFETAGEVVVQCKGEEDVELCDTFRYEGEAYSSLRDRVREDLRAVRDRASASRVLPSGSYDVILERDCVRTLVGYAYFQAEGKNIHTGYSQAKAGERLLGVLPDIRLVPHVPYSSEGIALRERELLRDGVLRSVVCDMRYSSYLGCEPTGEYIRLRAGSGERSIAEMKAEPHLYIVSFSDFQFDELDGYFGGEVRLGYYFDGHSTRAVTGFSVSGNFRTAASVEYSSERYSDYTYDGPAYIKIGGVTV